MRTTLNPIKTRSQMQRYSWLRQHGVTIEGVGHLQGAALDLYLDMAIHEETERKRAQQQQHKDHADGVPAE